MAEYMDKSDIADVRICEGIECDNCPFNDEKEEICKLRARLSALPCADVVGRSKIDKAIEEIRSEIKSIDYSLSVLDKSDSAKYEISAAKDGMTKAIDIFTKHMGEEE